MEERVVTVSSKGYRDLVGETDGKGLHWTTDVRSELPIKMRSSGVGSERPYTLC